MFMLIHKHTLRKYKTERRGFEPPDAFTSPVFKTGAIGRSATFPNFIELQSPIYELCVSFSPLATEYLLVKGTFSFPQVDLSLP